MQQFRNFLVFKAIGGLFLPVSYFTRLFRYVTIGCLETRKVQKVFFFLSLSLTLSLLTSFAQHLVSREGCLCLAYEFAQPNKRVCTRILVEAYITWADRVILDDESWP